MPSLYITNGKSHNDGEPFCNRTIKYPNISDELCQEEEFGTAMLSNIANYFVTNR